MPNWLSKWLRPNRPPLDSIHAHMTFGQTSVARTVRRTGLFLKKQLWVWPIIAVILLSIAGYAVSTSINSTIKNSLQSELSTLLSVERAMLEKWFKVQELRTLSLANDQQVRRSVIQLLAVDKQSLRSTSKIDPILESGLSAAELREQLRGELEASMSSLDFVGFIVADKQQRVIAAQTNELVGQTLPHKG